MRKFFAIVFFMFIAGGYQLAIGCSMPEMMGGGSGGHKHGGNQGDTGKQQHGNANQAPSKAVEATPVASVNASALLDSYLKMQAALSGDNFRTAGDALIDVKTSAKAEGQGAVELNAADGKTLGDALAVMSEVDTIEKMRSAFAKLSDAVIAISRTHSSSMPLYVLNCPMYNGGANWIQKDKAVKNPYYGKSMLTCGELKEIIQ